MTRIGSPVVRHATQFTQSGAQTWNVNCFQGQTCAAGADARAGETRAGAKSHAFILRGILLASAFNSFSFCRACRQRLERRSLCFSSSAFFFSASCDNSLFLASRALSCMCLNSHQLIEVLPEQCVILLYASSSVSRRVVYCRGIDFAFGGNGYCRGIDFAFGGKPLVLPWKTVFTMGIGAAARKKLCGPTRLEDSQLRAWASTRTGVWRTRGCNRTL